MNVEFQCLLDLFQNYYACVLLLLPPLYMYNISLHQPGPFYFLSCNKKKMTVVRVNDEFQCLLDYLQDDEKQHV